MIPILRGACAALLAAVMADAACAPEGSSDGAGTFGFVVVASDTGASPSTAETLRAIDVSRGDVRFVVHFESAAPSQTSCGDEALDRRRQALDASAKPVVPVPAASEWADCGDTNIDPFERLQRVGDVLFGSDQSLGQAPMPWLRESALPRFHRSRENVRWQAGRVLFATVNLPHGNNGFRIGAGRNGEFEERLVANRAWLDRTFRLATERKLLGVVLFVDAAPRLATPLHSPDLRTHERDGFYEWKLALREHAATYKGRMLVVQGHRAPGATGTPVVDHPLRDAGGHPIEHLSRVAAPQPDGDPRWMRVDIDPTDPKLFRIAFERAFDDPSGELYGPARGK